MDFRIANREDPGKTAVGSWVCTACLSLFWQATSVQHLRALTVYCMVKLSTLSIRVLTFLRRRPNNYSNIFRMPTKVNQIICS